MSLPLLAILSAAAMLLGLPMGFAGGNFRTENNFHFRDANHGYFPHIALFCSPARDKESIRIPATIQPFQKKIHGTNRHCSWIVRRQHRRVRGDNAATTGQEADRSDRHPRTEAEDLARHPNLIMGIHTWLQQLEGLWQDRPARYRLNPYLERRHPCTRTTRPEPKTAACPKSLPRTSTVVFSSRSRPAIPRANGTQPCARRSRSAPGETGAARPDQEAVDEMVSPAT
jgi:hypothetical protein